MKVFVNFFGYYLIYLVSLVYFLVGKNSFYYVYEDLFELLFNIKIKRNILYFTIYKFFKLSF